MYLHFHRENGESHNTEHQDPRWGRACQMSGPHRLKEQNAGSAARRQRSKQNSVTVLQTEGSHHGTGVMEVTRVFH